MAVEKIVDEASQDPSEAVVEYEINSYGADYDVEGLVRRLDRNEIIIPPFQRNYIWKQREASRFIESLLLGLPVPGIFLAREKESNKLLVIDGQQRLKSLQFFYNGFFKPEDDPDKKRVFKLIGVIPRLEGKTYETLEEQDRIKFGNCLLHATIIKQESPDDNNTSVYHIFDRLNSEGRRLTPQEIRTAVGHGAFIEFLKELNEFPYWREIYGKKSDRLKDQELILRFLALYYDREHYQSPMKEFLDRFLQKHRSPTAAWLAKSQNVFENTIENIYKALGRQAFRRNRAFNAAVFDAVSVGVAERLEKIEIVRPENLAVAYNKLLENEAFDESVTKATANEVNLQTRIQKAIDFFAGI